MITESPNAEPHTRPGLSTEAIVDAACELIRASHVDELTMRKLSEHLGVALGATYHYVSNRDELLSLVAQRINARIALESADARKWRTTTKNLMLSFAQAYSEYPGMSAFATTHLQATGPGNIRDDLLGLLTAAGFTLDGAYEVLATFLFYVSGALVTGLIIEDQPGYHSSELNRSFEGGLDLILLGAEARLRADKRAAATKSAARRPT